MENKATAVLDQRIAELQEKIIQNKVDIAELFVKIHTSKPLLNSNLDEFMSKIHQMDKMPPLIAALEKNEMQLDTLMQSKSEIEQAYLLA